MTLNKKTLLLTGGSGILGRALIDELAEDFDLVCLRNRRPIADQRVIAEFSGHMDDLSLGLAPQRYADLARRVDVIVHSAAVTNWKEHPDTITETNLAGSSAMLALADAAQAPLYFISTAFVANPPQDGDNFPGPAAYVKSKIAAEQFVRESPTDTVIVRPSIISGSTVDGQMAAFQGLHRVLGAVVRGRVPMVPCDPDSLIDAMPQDIVAAAIGTLLRENINHGEYWLTAGAKALRAAELCELCLELSRDLGLAVDAPRFISSEAVDRLLLPLLEDAVPAEMQQSFRDYMELLWMFQTPEPLPTSMSELGFDSKVSRDVLHDAAAKSLRYWATTKGLFADRGGQVA